MNTTITFRTDNKTKEEATKIYDALGMNLSVALNLFLKQTVIQQKFPCSLDLDLVSDTKYTYPEGFFNLFGKGRDLGFDEEPSELKTSEEDIELWNIT